jgi:acyl-CoA thioester hydrolase
MIEGGIEVWRGGVNAWQCDQMGHLNVRFYVAHAMEGLAGLAGALGMESAFATRGASTVQVRQHHVRFLKEARLGDPLNLSGGVLEFGEDDARFFMLLAHSEDGSPAAVIQTEVVHVSAADGRRFPWSQSVRRRADSLKVSIPEGLGHRSLDPAQRLRQRTLADAESAGLIHYGAGAYGPEDCDVFGRVAPHRLVGRMIDGAGHGFAVIAEATGGRSGMAAVEYRIAYFDPARAGDRYAVRAALVQAEPRRLGFAYWTFDAATGAPLAAARSVLVPFDLKARKAMSLPDDAVARLTARVTGF